MANLTGILGTMLASGMAGRSRRGPAFANSPFGMGGPTAAAASGGMGGAASGGMGGLGNFRNAAGLAALGYLAYRAYQERQGNMAAGGSAPPPRPETGGGMSLGDRLMGMLRPEQQQAPEQALGDQKALLLIRAMIAAAYADGEITAEERQRILGKLDEAGASAEDRRLLEQELDSPRSMDAVVREVRDPETAEQVYLASVLAIEPDSQAERSYLQYLSSRLNLDPGRVQELNQAA